MSAPITSPFTKLFNGGYRLLVPIVPHDAVLSDRTHLKPKSRGKAPGMRNAEGKWTSIKDWQTAVTAEKDLAGWTAMGAGVGIRTGPQPDGTWLEAIDADTLDAACAGIIEAQVEGFFGSVPTRVGNAPKALYLIRVEAPPDDQPIPYMSLAFEGGVLEVLGRGKQFVAGPSIHPTTRQPYRWTWPLCKFEDLPVRTVEQLQAFLSACRAALPEAGDLYQEGAGNRSGSQQALIGDLAELERAIPLIPNVYKAPGRANFVKTAAAFRGAFQNHYERGLELFEEWAEKADLSSRPDDAAHEDPAQVYRSVKAPYGCGAGWLFELAEAADPSGQFKRADALAAPYFDHEAAAAQSEAPAPVATAAVATPSVWFSPPSWAGQVIKPREWEVENWIPRRQVTLLYGDGGIGKTLLVQQFATAMAAGIPWLGQITRPGRVLCVFCEDDPDELHRRQADINRALGLTNGDLANMLITSRTHEDNVLATWGRDGRMELRPFWYEVRDRALAFRADAIILDPLSDIYAGSEIDRGQVTTFVKGGLGRLAHEIGGSIVVLAHPSQSGMSSGQGTSGSSAWSNAVRSRLYLSTLSDKARELTNMKLNYGPKGSKLKLEWHQGAFRVTSGTTPAGVQVGMGSILSIDDANEQAVAKALNECRGQQMTLATTSKYNAPKLLKRTAPETLAALKPEEVTLALDRLVGRGEVEVASLGKDPHSRDRPTLVFVGKAAVEGQSKSASAGSG